VCRLLSRFRAEAASVLGSGAGTDRQREHETSDDATLAELILQAEASAAWAREWLGASRTRRNHWGGQQTDAAMPNGPNAFAQP
jgi:hypothetical protein